MSAISKLTPRDQELLPLVWLCLQGEPKVDFQKLAKEGGFTNVGSAYNAWTRIAKKLSIPKGNKLSSNTCRETKSVTLSPKRKRVVSEMEDPVKRSKTSPIIRSDPAVQNRQDAFNEDCKPSSDDVASDRTAM
ncbi:hypothetical protein Slin14017_G040880 [Septoria linicola]|nr:hypothetical protein Slin14017_G040880 [Septoria linicola]